MPSLLGGINEKAFERFVQPLKDGFDSQTFKLSRNTTVYISENHRFIELWGSNIVEFMRRSNGTTSLVVCLCGYATDTTMRRINTVLWKMYENGTIHERYYFNRYKGGAVFGTREHRCEWDADTAVFFNYCHGQGAHIDPNVERMIKAGMQSEQSKAMKATLNGKRRKFSQMEAVL